MIARNTVDSLSTIRKLKDNNVECYFEKEGLWTFDSKSEVILSIMSSLAQEESRSISENVKWGIRKKYEDGRFSMPYSSFLGYDRGEDGTMVINEEQAKIVRRIFGLYLKELKKLPQTVTQFDEDAWYALIDYLTAYRDGRVVFRFKDGKEVTVKK